MMYGLAASGMRIGLSIARPSGDGMERTVCDYIVGMTDKYAGGKYAELFIPSGWHVRG